MIGRTILPITAGQQITVGTGKYAVTFYDFDGTVLKIHKVNAGENATAPTTPTHEFLTFNSWNNPFTNVQNDIDVGAIYNTSDGKTYLFISVNSITGLAPTLYFSKSSTSLMTINWGDGTTSTSTTSGNQNINHTYAVAGDYIITVDNSAGGTWSIGNGSSITTLFYGYQSIISKIYFGANMITFSRYAMATHSLIRYVSWGTYLLTMPVNSELFFGAQGIKHCNLPIGVTLIGTSIFGTNPYSLRKVVLPNTVTTMYIHFMSNAAVDSIIIPASIITLNSSTFTGCQFVNYFIILATTPPSFGATVFLGISPNCKIYVPDASVAAYKAATNIVGVYDSYIYPLSTKP